MLVPPSAGFRCQVPDEQIAGLNLERSADVIEGIKVDAGCPARIERVRGVVSDTCPRSQRLDRQALVSGQFANSHRDWHGVLPVRVLCSTLGVSTPKVK
jgi:hypothetical protein